MRTNVSFIYLVFCFGVLQLLSVSQLYCQGGWDIDYIPQKFIDSKIINKEVRIDFKSFDYDRLRKRNISKLKIRELLIPNDTIQIVICDSSIKFVEEWVIYDDEGFLKHQHLKSLDHPNGNEIIIREMILKNTSPSYISLEATLYEKGNSLTKECKINIKKSKIKGLLIVNQLN